MEVSKVLGQSRRLTRPELTYSTWQLTKALARLSKVCRGQTLPLLCCVQLTHAQEGKAKFKRKCK